ncbi:MAG: hypothetical protein KGO52_07825 [Nitrospirota bacterium]|nr:hypothetical protein [Nitrospirota bacterium]MDE3118748.1 hypothetical protein [Nitrospirota bacterium]MDE3242610.1 hypothetical protein [Nitrospirota bacterium]
MNWVSILVSALVSGLLGVGISTWYHERSEIRRAKIQVLQQLLGNRNDLKGQQFSEALNKVLVIFYDSQDVLTALKAFHEISMNPARSNDVSNQKLLDLFKAMCRDLKIRAEPLTDNFFLQPFNVKG